MPPIVPKSKSMNRDAIQTATIPAGTWIKSFFKENSTMNCAAPEPAAR